MAEKRDETRAAAQAAATEAASTPVAVSAEGVVQPVATADEPGPALSAVGGPAPDPDAEPGEPVAVQGLRGEMLSGSSVQLSWTSQRGMRFTVERSDEGGEFAQLGRVDSAVYRDDGLRPGVTYGYRVIASKGSKHAPASGVLPVTGGR